MTTQDQVLPDSVKGRSLWDDAFRRFKANRAAMISLIVLVFVAAFAIFGNYLTQWDYETVDWFALEDVEFYGKPAMTHPNEYAAEIGTAPHYFGTDSDGRDLLARLVQGSRISLMVGLMGALVAVVIGTIYGAVSGYMGGKVDSLMMRAVEILMSFPFMFLVIVLMAIFGRNVLLIFIAIGAVSWLDMARIVRGQTLSLKNKEFVEAAIAQGVRTPVIIMRHIVPNVLGVVVVYATLLVPQMILFESFISFLGLGVSEPQTSWGALISAGADSMRITPWQLIFPLLALTITLFCFNFVGDGLRDALDPKNKK
ncbi:ABC transporter permease subunit [Salinibius halmophilus]|uniref:ABC transporter permease subunit n=1 Tax=Salinibius halmophilus TaxID=1853216 RepID=UPI000E664CBE|nr:ABC transporter permease subunit [Salinibius halmophilus]